MKKLSLLFAGILLSTNLYAQAPNKMSYQAVVRNASNALVAGKPVGIKISILQSSSTGTAVYSETHTPNTNTNGLATIEIGGGTVTSGTFAAIDWSKGPFFIKTETDPTGGTNYTISATSQLLSVPFAMMANSSATAGTANALSPTATGVVRSINGQGGSLVLKGGGGTSISKNGDTVLVSSTGGAGGTGIQGVQSTDGIVQITNPNGPIATLNINNASIPATKLAAGVLPTTLPPSGAAGGDLGGTYPNPSVIKLQGRPIATTLPTVGQSLGWDGTQWAPSSGSSGWSLTGNAAINPLTNYIGTNDTQPLIMKTNSVERLRVLGTGNVGIGTATPASKLDVAGTVNAFDGLYIRNIKTISNDGAGRTQFFGIDGTTIHLEFSGTTTDFQNKNVYVQQNLGVGLNPASQNISSRLSVNGGLSVGSTYSTTNAAPTNGAIFQGNVGIGTSTPNATLHVVGSNILALSGSATSPTSFSLGRTVGEADFGIAGTTGQFSSSAVSGDVVLRSQSTASKLILQTGGGAAHMTLSNGNVGIGTSTPGAKLEVAGGDIIVNSVRIGKGAGSGNNESVGIGGLGSNTTGYANTAVGIPALPSNTTGSDNTAMGHRALLTNSTGDGNTAIGVYSCYNTNSSGNVAVGIRAMEVNTTGSNNVALGTSADVTTGTFSNAIAIGFNAKVNASNKAVIGNTSVSSIGGQVAWSSFSDARIKDNIQENIHGLDFINELRPVSFHYNVDKQNQLAGLKNSSEWDSKRAIEKIAFSGFLAQEVEAASQKVGYDFSGVDKSGDILGLRYSEFVVPLVKAVQELSQQNQELQKGQADIQTLKTQNAELQKRLDALTAQMQALTIKVSSSEAAVVK